MNWYPVFSKKPVRQVMLKFKQWVDICAGFNQLQDEVITSVIAGDGIDVTDKSDNTVTISTTQQDADSGDYLPEGGSQYQVLQRDSDGQAVWDYPRFHV